MKTWITSPCLRAARASRCRAGLAALWIVWSLGHAGPAASQAADGASTPAVERPAPTGDAVGFLVGSLSRVSDELAFDHQKIKLVHAPTGAPVELVFELSPALIPGLTLRGETERTRVDFRLPESIGQVFVLPLPPGEYRIRNYEMHRAANMHRPFGATSFTWTSKEELQVPLRITAGRALYIGELKVVPGTTKNLIGMVRYTGGRWVVSDQLARDLPLLRARGLGVSDEAIDKGLVSLP